LAIFGNNLLKDQAPAGQARQDMGSLTGMAAISQTEHFLPKLEIVEAHDTVVKRIAEAWLVVSSLKILAGG
jgi:hypothetical protein